MTQPRTNAGHDDNFVPTLIGVSTADGIKPVPVEVDPATGEMQVSDTALLAALQGGNAQVSLSDVLLALRQTLNVLVRPPWLNQAGGTLRVTLAGDSIGGTSAALPYIGLQGLWTSTSSQSNGTLANQFSPTDSLINPLNRDSFANSIRARIN